MTPHPPKDHPMLFSAPMVQALLAGRKTQTRRVVKHQPRIWSGVNADPPIFSWLDDSGHQRIHHRDKGIADMAPFCRYQPGDRLWVRETWACVHGVPDSDAPHPDDFVRYRADDGPGEHALTEVRAWRPSIFMPRAYSRIALEVTAVRAERLQDISEADARAEGVDGVLIGSYDDHGVDATALAPAVANFARLWNQLNAKPGRTWDDNPVVWVIEFKQVTL